jgi:hypothetical protein
MQTEQTPIYEPFDIQAFITANLEKQKAESAPDLAAMRTKVKDGTRTDGFAFTYNNFTHTPEQLLEILQTLPNIIYAIFQIEKGETGTVHYQGYMHFSKRMYWGGLRMEFLDKGLHRLNFSNRFKYSTPQNASDYCQKIFDKDTGKQTKLTPEIYTFGTLPEYKNEQGKRNDLIDFFDKVKSGANDKELIEHDVKNFAIYKKNIDVIRNEMARQVYATQIRDITVTYIWGKTGVGKTEYIFNKHGFENVYIIDDYKNPWDTYNGQDVVVFDEFRSNFDISRMLRWLDRYPLTLQARYNNKQACYTKVYITSNIPLSEQYRDVDIETYKAFLRRIKSTQYFDEITHEPVQQTFPMDELCKSKN